MTDAPANPTAPERNVFISYASQDKAVADAVCEALESAGVVCWIAPRDVTPGEFYAESIVHAIDSTKVIVLVLSQHSADSQHVLSEVERARSRRHPVVSLRIDAVPLPAALEYFLNTSQWLDASTTGVAGSLPRLVDAVKTTLSQPVTSARTAAAPPATTRSSAPGRPVLIALAVLFSVALAYLALTKFWLPKPTPAPSPVTSPSAPTATISEKSIAVLPFVDMSEKHDQEYFSDGLSEELIDHLAHIPDLKVIARTSSFAFKGKNEDMRSIASELGVANLLEGSVRKAGGELRITAQLIRASDGVHLWSEIYDRKLADIFKVQDEISTTVAKALSAALNMTSAVSVIPAAKGTTQVEAYNLLLQGNYFLFRLDKDDDAKAVEFYQKALKLDPHYALAWAKLARAYAWRGALGNLSAAEGEAKGRDAVQRALAIDPNSAEAYYARGNISRYIDGDWTSARADFERAAALDSHGELGVRAEGNILRINASISGHTDALIEWLHRYLERNPLDTSAISELALLQLSAGLLDKAAATSRKLLELNPAFDGGQALYGWTLLLMGKPTEALSAVEKESDDEQKLLLLACVYWTMGRRAESNSALGTLERTFAVRNGYDIAAVHAYRGETDAAFVWLERTYQQKKGDLAFLRLEPLFRNLHGDPRFDAFLRKAKLME
jgi:TolB-like protein